MLVAPLPAETRAHVALEKGPNIPSLPELEPLPDALEVPVLLKVGDDISTDEIMPAGARVLPFRSNIRADQRVRLRADRSRPTPSAREADRDAGHVIVAGNNYGQGSSREHAALAPRFLGLRAVLAVSSRASTGRTWSTSACCRSGSSIPSDYDRIEQGDFLSSGLHKALRARRHSLQLENYTRGTKSHAHALSPRQVEMLLAGGLIPLMRRRSSTRRELVDGPLLRARVAASSGTY